MSDDGYRRERVDRLLHELRHEIERGVLNREIPEAMSFRFLVPVSERGEGFVVSVRFEMRPIARNMIDTDPDAGRLRVIEGGKQQ